MVVFLPSALGGGGGGDQPCGSNAIIERTKGYRHNVTIVCVCVCVCILFAWVMSVCMLSVCFCMYGNVCLCQGVHA